jgi:hypothetical protein
MQVPWTRGGAGHRQAGWGGWDDHLQLSGMNVLLFRKTVKNLLQVLSKRLTRGIDADRSGTHLRPVTGKYARSSEREGGGDGPGQPW